MRLLAALSLLLAGCSSYTLGPQVAYNDNLGNKRPSFGIVAQGESEWGRQEVRVLSVDKGGGGWAVTSRTLFGYARPRFVLGIGLDAVHVSTAEWQKTSASPIVQGRILADHAEWEVTVGGPDGDKVEGFVGLRMSGKSRWAPIFDYEYVRHSEGYGQRVAVGLVRRFR